MSRKTRADWLARIAHYKRMMARCYVFLEDAPDHPAINDARMALIDTPEHKNVGINDLDIQAAATEINDALRAAQREYAESLIERGQTLLKELEDDDGPQP